MDRGSHGCLDGLSSARRRVPDIEGLVELESRVADLVRQEAALLVTAEVIITGVGLSTGELDQVSHFGRGWSYDGVPMLLILRICSSSAAAAAAAGSAVFSTTVDDSPPDRLAMFGSRGGDGG